jgi:hypothetical protein
MLDYRKQQIKRIVFVAPTKVYYEIRICIKDYGKKSAINKKFARH